MTLLLKHSAAVKRAHQPCVGAYDLIGERVWKQCGTGGGPRLHLTALLPVPLAGVGVAAWDLHIREAPIVTYGCQFAMLGVLDHLHLNG